MGREPFSLTILNGKGKPVYAGVPGKSGFAPQEQGGRLQFVAAKAPDEHFYGFGEKFNGVNQAGNMVVMKLADAYQSADSDETYKSIPFFLSTGGYGMLVNSGMRIVFHMGDLDQTSYTVDMPDSQIDFYVFANDDPLKVIEEQTQIAGRTKLVPEWSFEPWLSRREMVGWTSPAVADADVDMMLADGYRLGVVLWEGFRRRFGAAPGQEPGPDILALSDKWHGLGIKQVFWSMTGQFDDSDASQKLYGYRDEGVRDYFVQNPDGSFLLGGINGGKVYIDPTNPEAMKWWIDNIYAQRIVGDNGHATRERWNLDGVKIDFPEFFPGDEVPMKMHDRPKGMANLHSVLFTEQIYDWLQTVKPEGGITWLRGGGLGIQKAGFVWSGDRGRTFSQHAGTVRGNLSLSLCGVPLEGQDLGGYTGGGENDAEETYIRGVQYAAFSPSFHDHGSAQAPWEQTEYGRENYKFYSRLRYNLIPYLYHYVRVAKETGAPLMRTLYLHYPNDSNVFGIEDEYMLGESLLVAPFVAGGTSRDVYLPRGEWIDFWTGERFIAPRKFKWSGPLNRIPVFAKGPSIVPLDMNAELEPGGLFPQEKKNSLLLTFNIFGGGAATLNHYDADGSVISVAGGKTDGGFQATVENIGRNFAVRVRGSRPAGAKVNGAAVPELKPDAFKGASAGWRYDEASQTLLVKIAFKEGTKKYEAVFEGFDPDAAALAPFEIEQPAPAIKISRESKAPAANQPVFSPEDGRIFIYAEHDFRHKKSTASFKYEYAVSVGEPAEYSLWVKAKNLFFLKPGELTADFNGQTLATKKVEQLYDKWYDMGRVQMEKGENRIRLSYGGRSMEVDKLFLSSIPGDRPYLKDEKETRFVEQKEAE